LLGSTCRANVPLQAGPEVERWYRDRDVTYPLGVVKGGGIFITRKSLR